MKKKERRIGGAILDLRMTAKIRARSYLAKMENIALVDTQSIRARLLRKLNGLFESVDSREDEGFKAENSSGLNLYANVYIYEA